MSSVLSIQNATKRFGSTDALCGAGFTVDRGEWLALLGPNGAGKTTTVKAVAGRVDLDGGTMELLGQPLDGTNDEAVRRRLGVVPQEIALYPKLTARENLAAWGALSGHGLDLTRADLRRRIDWALDWTGLADRAEARVDTYSGGMKRRLNIAASVLHEPEVILLDEPTVGVDPQSRQRIWEMLDTLRQDGAALVLTTHQLDEAQQVCDRIVIIDHGRTIADGTFDELVDATLGAGRRVTFVLAADAPEGLTGYDVPEPHTLRANVSDIAAELPGHLQRLAQAGAIVRDIRVDAPSLQAVFIELTGHELRE